MQSGLPIRLHMITYIKWNTVVPESAKCLQLMSLQCAIWRFEAFSECFEARLPVAFLSVGRFGA